MDPFLPTASKEDMADQNPDHLRLEAAITRRDKVAQTVQHLLGRLAAAQDDVASIEAECVERGVPPDKLDAAIVKLKQRYEKSLAVFERDITEAEGKLAPFIQE